jgi:putative hydrolase of the HAD superfamily
VTPHVRLVSFDAGGVLLFPNWDRVSAALARAGIHVAPDELRRADAPAKYGMDHPAVAGATNNAGHGSLYFSSLLAAAGVDLSQDLGPAIDEVRAENAASNLWDLAASGVQEVLAELRAAGLTLIVVSNADGRLRSLLDGAGLTGFFDAVVDSQLVGAEKPDPAIFTGVLSALDVDAAHAVHVGDFYTIDVVGARAAGMEPVLLDPAGLHGDRDCPRIASLSELPAMLGAERRG